MLLKPNINQFSPSVNIDRDADRDLIYYPTENSKRIFHQIINDFKLGTHVFNIVGSFGTGKSSFLWALEQNIVKGKPYFSGTHFERDHIEVLRLVGDHRSIIQCFADLFEADIEKSLNDVFSKLFYHYRTAIKQGLLIIMIDEFGKFLEYASEHYPEKELYFLQQLAEFVSKPEYNILFLTTVHQNFDAYAFGLKNAQRQEWAKVKGRFKELTFNEPVEQLLKLAAEHLRTVTRKDADDEMLALQLSDLFKRSKAFELADKLSSEDALDLLPLDLLSANVLTIALQRYGQNERSLFSFLISSDHTSISKVSRGNRCFSLAHVYDYLLFNFYSYLHSKYNPDYAAWKSIRNILDEVERTFDHQVDDLSKLVKTIGLLNLTAAQGSKLNNDFLSKYAKLCLSIADPKPLIEKLKSKNVILFRDHLQRFTLNEGTSLDMQAALIEAASKVDQVNDVAHLLKRYYSLPPVLAKNYSYETGTPRVFEFVITDKLRFDQAAGEIDGFIYLLFNEKVSLDDVKAHSLLNEDSSCLYVYYENSKTIKDLLFELEKLQKVKEENGEDRVAVRLLNESLEASQRTLNHFILGNLHTDNQNLKWVWNGKEQSVGNKRSFNQLLSAVCETAYPNTPVFNNELLNKHKISPSIASARKNYFKALVNNWDQIDLGFEKDKFPPEKTIYLSLIKANNISISIGDINLADNQNNFAPLWNISLDFLESARGGRKNLTDFIEVLSTKPFKIKQGLISFWVPTFLFIKRDEFALFGENGYVPFMTEETLDLIIRYPERYEIKAFDIEGTRLSLFNQYRELLQQSAAETLNNQNFIDTIRPFLSFYRQLPEFTKATKKNLSKEAKSLRKVIAGTEDLEQTFFEDFPEALGYHTDQLSQNPELIPKYVAALEATIKEIRTCYDTLIDRFENTIQDRIIGTDAGFDIYKPTLIARYESLKPYLTAVEQKIFLQRVTSNIDDRKAWLNSIAQTLTGKALEAFSDDDEFLLKDEFVSMINSLDKLADLANTDFDIHAEDVLGFEINSFIDGVNKTIIRLPKNKRDEISVIENQLRMALSSSGSNDQLNIVALANLLKEFIQS
ncbi:MAG: hypothetical protein WC615_00295 [Mucilaginibacter sp.]|jgi:hypothetical protein|uniref:hypothetical protein n=1 Tax=Mucilaginibacter sp. TaxID=1882438 RepID=UPI003567DEFD